MKLKFVVLTILVVILSFNKCLAQCKDENKVNLTFPCFDLYRPVCGCDNVTYRNICSAEQQNGIFPGAWREGTCTGFEFDVVPTYSDKDLTFTFVQALNDTRIANLFIADRDGVILYYKTLYPDLSGRVELNIVEFSGFKPGVYIMFMFNNQGEYRYKKIVKY